MIGFLKPSNLQKIHRDPKRLKVLKGLKDFNGFESETSVEGSEGSECLESYRGQGGCTRLKRF